VTTYIIRRLLQALLILVCASAFAYYVLSLLPGSPLSGLYMEVGSKKMSIGEIHRLGRLWGWLDADNHTIPWYARFSTWLFSPDRPGIDAHLGPFHLHGGGILTGNWGTSVFFAPGHQVIELIGTYLPFTLILMGASMLVSLLIAIPIGVYSAVRQYSRLDYALTLFSFVGISIPGYWLGWMLLILLGVQFKTWGLPALPLSGAYDAGLSEDVGNRIFHLILPVFVLSLQSIAGWSRFVRAQMLEVLYQDYVRTAWAKGLQPRVVVLKHAFRNALIPLITLAALSLPGLFGGALLVETVFSYPGMARMYMGALGSYDWSVVMGYLLIGTVVTVLGNLLGDILYAVADPRIRYS
jgi:peptide/nickel transport system permease protein